MEAIQRFHDFSDLPIHLLNDVTAHSSVTHADKRGLGHAWDVRFK